MKKYTPPDMEIIIYESEEDVMLHLSGEDPFSQDARSIFSSPSAQSYINSLPQGFVDTDE